MKEPMGSIVGGKNSISEEAAHRALLLRESSLWPYWKRVSTTTTDRLQGEVCQYIPLTDALLSTIEELEV